MQFARKNIFSNIQMFMSFFPVSQLSVLVADEIVTSILQLINELVKE